MPDSSLGLAGPTLKDLKTMLFFSEFIGDKTKESLFLALSTSY